VLAVAAPWNEPPAAAAPAAVPTRQQYKTFRVRASKPSPEGLRRVAKRQYFRMHASTPPTDLDFAAVFAALPTATAVFAADPPHFTVLWVNDALCTASQRPREALVGRPLAEAFPNASTGDPQGAGLAELRVSLEACLQTGSLQRMHRQRYDLQCADGSWQGRYWEAVNVPVPGRDGAVRRPSPDRGHHGTSTWRGRDGTG
jgi:hypothetical protein